MTVSLLCIGWLSGLGGCRKETSESSSPRTSETNPASGSAQDKLFGDELGNPSALVKDNSTRSSLPANESAENRLHFTDVAQSSGLRFLYRNGEQGESLMVESTGGGVGVIDFDCDGHADLCFSQGGDPQAPADEAAVALFRNVTIPANTHDGTQAMTHRWTNVASSAGIGSYGYGQAVAVGDYNADGFQDIYLTYVGANVLLQNQGDGTFENVTLASGTQGGENGIRWSSSAAFADLSGDGLLDLFVCNYVNYDPMFPIRCRNSRGENRICHPREMEPLTNCCFINRGDGTFRDEAVRRGLVGPGSKSLGVAIADFDVDGDTDVYVANDTTANFLFLNDGSGNYLERALLRGCAVSGDGLFQASMGLAIGDFDHNGFPDIYSTHYYDESNTLYRNLGETGFQDVTSRMGLHVPTLHSLAFGTVMHDFDFDGWDDLFITNGHVENYAGNPIHRMPPQLFQFDEKRWIERSETAGVFFQGKYVGRGVASLDIENDGDLDLAVVHQNSPAALLRNDASDQGHWLKVRLIGRDSPREGTGCLVTVHAGDLVLHQQRYGGGSFASSHQPELVFGLGTHNASCEIEVDWPSGKSSLVADVDVDQELVIIEPLAR